MKRLWHRFLPILLIALPLALMADATPDVTHDSAGNEITTTTQSTSNTQPDGTYTEETVTTIVVKDKDGNVLKKTSKYHDVKYKTKGGKKLKTSDGSTVSEYSVAGHETTITNTEVNHETGAVDEVVTVIKVAGDGTTIVERTTTHTGNGEKKVTKERKNMQSGKWEEISNAQPPAQDAVLTNDPRFTHVTATPQNGGGTDDGTYLPPIAHQGEIIGSVLSDEAGPTNFYVATVTSNGDEKIYQGKTDDAKHFHLRIPVIAGLTALLLFKEFDRNGKPDKGSSCQITDKPVHLENTEVAQRVPASGPAITEANTAYERGGFSKGLVQIQTRGTDALHSKLLLDGADKQIDTYGASDMSMIGKLHDDTPLGRHEVGAQTGAQRLNDQQADIVTQRIAPLAPMKPGQVATVHVHFDGLGTDEASVRFTVEGSASVADGSDTKVVPVSPNGDCQIDIKAKQPGQLIIRTVLMVAMVPFSILIPNRNLAQTETPVPGGPTVNPQPTDIVPTHQPTPTPTETPFPTTTEKPHGPGYQPPPCQPVADGAFEPTQGVWQDDPKFEDHPTKQITRPDPAVPHYNAELDMISYRDTLLFGVDRYRLTNGAFGHGWGHYVIQMTVVSDCSDPPKGVAMRFTLERGTATPGKLIYQSPELAKIPLTGHHVNPKTYYIFLDTDEGIPPPPHPPFRIAAFGEYLVKDELVTDDNKGTGLIVTVGGNVHGTYSVKIAFLAVTLTPATDAAAKAVDDASEALGVRSGRYIPDYYPMQPHSIEAWALDPIDLSKSKAMTDPIPNNDYPGRKPEDVQLDIQITRSIAVQAELSKQLDALTRLAHYQRYVVVMPKDDFELINGKGVIGLAMTEKILLVREGESYFVVMHELAHTLPNVWSEFEMSRDCSAPGNYHNLPVAWANGFRIDTGGVPGPREKKDHKYPFMSGADEPYGWIAQCTYWNLAKALRKKPDPPALLVRGLVSRAGGKPGALIWPYYDIDSEIGLQSHAATAGEQWAVVYKDASGTALATFPFEPQWADENGRQRDIVPFSFQIPRMAGVSAVELQGPNGFVLRRTVSSAPPSVHIATPGVETRHAGSATVALSWTAAVSNGRQWSTVLYSNDAGKSYHPRVFEEPVTRANIKVDPKAHHHRIKVIVTDGSQSTEQTLDFTTK